MFRIVSMESYHVYQWESGGAQERRELVSPMEKWAISGVPDLTRGEFGWGVLGVRKSPAWIHNCDLTCVGHSAVDARLGDADVAGRSIRRVTVPS